VIVSAGRAPRRHIPAAHEILHDLRQVVVGNVELGRDLGGRERRFRRIREPHQYPQTVVGKSREAHRCPLIGIYNTCNESYKSTLRILIYVAAAHRAPAAVCGA
jgi:hypothetical protein